MKIVERYNYQEVHLPNGQVRRIAIPQIKVVYEDHQKTQSRHRSFREHLPRLDKKTKLSITCFLAVVMLGLAIISSPPPTAAVNLHTLESPTFANTNCQLSQSYSPNIFQWKKEIEYACLQYEIPANLLGALIEVESNGDQFAVSKDWACGLTQVVSNSNMMTNNQGERYFADRPSCAQLTNDPQFAINTGAQMLRNHYDRSGNWRDALFAYGPKGVGYSYADKIIQIYNSYQNQK